MIYGVRNNLPEHVLMSHNEPQDFSRWAYPGCRTRVAVAGLSYSQQEFTRDWPLLRMFSWFSTWELELIVCYMSFINHQDQWSSVIIKMFMVSIINQNHGWNLHGSTRINSSQADLLYIPAFFSVLFWIGDIEVLLGEMEPPRPTLGDHKPAGKATQWWLPLVRGGIYCIVMTYHEYSRCLVTFRS